MLTNIVLLPYEDHVFHGMDTAGENFYFMVMATFDFEGNTFAVYRDTVRDEDGYLGQLFEREGDGNMRDMLPIEDDDLYDRVVDIWNAYVDTIEEEGDDDND